VIAEAVAEVVDHGRTESVRVTARLDHGMLLIEVSDDGERRPGAGILVTAAIPLR
jgi:signal transduction histidine kinase